MSQRGFGLDSASLVFKTVAVRHPLSPHIENCRMSGGDGKELQSCRGSMIDTGTPNHAISQQANWFSHANTYGLLARLWVAEIDCETLSQLSEGDLRDAWLGSGGVLPELGDMDQVIDQLAIQYCGCFLGPKGHLPPHQSVVAHSRFQGDCLSSVRQFVDVIGMPEGSLFQKQKMMDHAGVLLALTQRICQSGAQCDAGDFSAAADLRASFFNAHLSWLIDYCKVATPKSKSAFYNGLFGVTSNFLDMETA